MISRRTSSKAKEDVFPRLLYSDSTCSQVLPGAPEGHSISAVNSDPSPGRREACISSSEGTTFQQSRQSRPEPPGCFWRKLLWLLKATSCNLPPATHQVSASLNIEHTQEDKGKWDRVCLGSGAYTLESEDMQAMSMTSNAIGNIV